MSFASQYVFPYEGLDYLMAVVPKGTTPSGLALGLWGIGTGGTTTWATISGYATAGNGGITLNSGTYPVYEQANFTGYTARSSLTAGTWGAQTTSTVAVSGNGALPVRYSTYGAAITITNQGTYTVSGIGGIFIATGASGTQAQSISAQGTTVVWYAPFTDGSTVTLASGDSIAITPTWQSATFQS